MVKNADTDFGSDYFEHEGAVLPCQVRPAISPMHARSGERLLMLAVLADAINIFLKGARERRLLEETRLWIRGGKDAYQPVSFEDACDALGINPRALRERLFRLKSGDLASAMAERHSSLMLKPPGISRGPVKVGPGPTRRSNRRRRAS
jgi:hypothetical protein